jgi:aspartate ammonia-lyase
MESDSIGSMEVPKEAYYGIQALRASRNFKITNKRIHKELIASLAEVKKAAAITNKNAQLLDCTIANAIINACDEIIAGKLHEYECQRSNCKSRN